jgi:hypothetical protein
MRRGDAQTSAVLGRTSGTVLSTTCPPGLPALELTVTEVKPNVAADIPVPDSVRQAGNPYVKVTTQKAADGVWYLTGGSHHSVVIEMKDHLIVVEGC